MKKQGLEKFILIHYAELALKLGNREFFEKKLIENIKRSLGNVAVKDIYGRFLLILKDDSDIDQYVKKLKKVPGIAYFSVVTSCSQNLKELAKQVKSILKPLKFKSFRISVRRVDKNLTYDSMTAEREIGAVIFTDLKRKVDLKHYELNCEIELVNKKALVSAGRFLGLGGLPVGSSGKLITLISGGIDSPVAAFKMIKRGAKNVFVHFHSYPATPKEGINKVKALVKMLNEYQQETKLYLIPFLNIQKEIVARCQADYRVIFYRRMMLRLAEKVAKKEESIGLVTGDSLGQVASQTLENICAISQSTSLPILRPLIGTDKEDIMKEARTMGTYDLSVFAAGNDCCSLYVPKHPVTRADLKIVQQVEKDWDFTPLINDAFNHSELIKY